MRRTHPASIFAHTNSSLILAPVLVAVLLAATGCTSTHRVGAPSVGQGERPSDAYGYSRVTEEITGETVQVFLRDGRTMKLKNLYVGVDSTQGTRPNGGSRQFPTSALRKIEVVDHGTGFWQGAGVGLGLGFVNGLVGAASSDSGDLFGPTAGFVIGLVTGVPLSLVGGLIGAASGQRDVYRFPEHSPRWNGATAPSGRRTETVRRLEE